MPNPQPKLLEKHIVQQVRDYLKHRGWRSVRTGVVSGPGYSMGEPGMTDYLFLHYMETKGVVIALWIEFKGPNDRRHCSCRPGESKHCKVCRQKVWHQRERARGAIVWVVDDLQWFVAEYESAYGWLHSGDTGRGQLDLLAGVGQ